ncbi:hypothetical protein BBW65_03520 [Helicobacter enhydrae]|uniref:Uncharacterized protein n=1 Tax=Helicobacter enhydrae TaxID=222136 RepID=A0A1B1U5G1_9HELI|nr:hypothetical protein BBW65_03520 [Helicobacter enhydrae]
MYEIVGFWVFRVLAKIAKDSKNSFEKRTKGIETCAMPNTISSLEFWDIFLRYNLKYFEHISHPTICRTCKYLDILCCLDLVILV